MGEVCTRVYSDLQSRSRLQLLFAKDPREHEQSVEGCEGGVKRKGSSQSIISSRRALILTRF